MSRRLEPASLVPGETQRERTLRLMRDRAREHRERQRALRALALPVRVVGKSGAVMVKGAAAVDPEHAASARRWSLWAGAPLSVPVGVERV